MFCVYKQVHSEVPALLLHLHVVSLQSECANLECPLSQRLMPLLAVLQREGETLPVPALPLPFSAKG